MTWCYICIYIYIYKHDIKWPTKESAHLVGFLGLQRVNIFDVVLFLLGDSLASEFYVPTFRNTVCYIFIGRVNTNYEDGTDSVPKRQRIKFRRREITQKNEYTIRDGAKV